MSRRPTTAVLLFSRSVAAEARSKQWTGVQRTDERLAATLLRHARRAVRRAGLPLLYIDERRQRGHHFGEKLANALEAGYARGYERILVIGNDCPNLTAASLRRAARLLERHRVVIGPAADGGLYLLGLHRSAYRRPVMLDLDWQTDQLAWQFTQQLARLDLSAATLSVRTDVDALEDLDRLTLLPSTTSLVSALRQLIQRKAISALVRKSTVTQLKPANQLRGPPAMV